MTGAGLLADELIDGRCEAHGRLLKKTFDFWISVQLIGDLCTQLGITTAGLVEVGSAFQGGLKFQCSPKNGVRRDECFSHRLVSFSK